jgi:hypothetical protein
LTVNRRPGSRSRWITGSTKLKACWEFSWTSDWWMRWLAFARMPVGNGRELVDVATAVLGGDLNLGREDS